MEHDSDGALVLRRVSMTGTFSVSGGELRPGASCRLSFTADRVVIAEACEEGPGDPNLGEETLYRFHAAGTWPNEGGARGHAASIAITPAGLDFSGIARPLGDNEREVNLGDGAEGQRDPRTRRITVLFLDEMPGVMIDGELQRAMRRTLIQILPDESFL